jgi:hypothetical protein
MRVAHAVERAADDLPPRFEQIPKQVRELLEQDAPLTVAKRQLRLRDAPRRPGNTVTPLAMHKDAQWKCSQVMIERHTVIELEPSATAR